MSIYSVFSVGMSQTRKLRFPFSVEGFGQGVEKIVPLVGAGGFNQLRYEMMMNVQNGRKNTKINELFR